VDQGSLFRNSVTVTQTAGDPLNLTGYTAASQMRKSYNSSIGYNLNATIINALEGKLRLELTTEQSRSIPPGRYLYDVEITSIATGEKTRVVEGIVIINPEITKI
jgi:hypothetical protein